MSSPFTTNMTQAEIDDVAAMSPPSTLAAIRNEVSFKFADSASKGMKIAELARVLGMTGTPSDEQIMSAVRSLLSAPVANQQPGTYRLPGDPSFMIRGAVAGGSLFGNRG